MKAFIICGYGASQDIANDTQYKTYLHPVFNRIFTESAQHPALIIPCGGPTNCNPPFNGTEAEAIRDYLLQLAKRKITKTQTKNWNIHPETASLSTLENLLFAKEILATYTNTKELYIFCEETRKQKVSTFAEVIFDAPATICPIDFDTSVNRYLDPSLLKEKEATSIQEGLWTLEDPKRIEQHHAFFEKKFAFLRKRQSEGIRHEDAVREWFERHTEIIKELMPDHPSLT